MSVLERVESLRTRNQLNIKAKNKDLYKLIEIISVSEIDYVREKSKVNITNSKIPRKKQYEDDDSIIFRHETNNFKKKLPKSKSTIDGLLNEKDLEDSFFKYNIIQKSIVLVLEAIYEPSFSKYNHDFEKNYYYTSNLKKIRTQWSNTTWMLQGNLNKDQTIIYPHILITILRKKIKDEKFLNVIWRFLQDNPTKMETQLVQILINIYLNELDIALEEVRFKINKQIKIQDPRPTSVFFNSDNTVIRKLNLVSTGPSWIIGLDGNKKTVEKLHQLINLFLIRKLRISTIPIKINCVSKTKIEFLDYILFRRKSFSGNKKIGFPKMETTQKFQCLMPINKIVKQLANKKFCTTLGKGVGKMDWILYPEKVIIQNYNKILAKLNNHYFLGDNYITSLRRIEYILRFSCAHTLAQKYRSNVSKEITRLSQLKFYDYRNFRKINNITPFKTKPKFVKASFNYLNTNFRVLSENICLFCTTPKNVEIHSIQIIGNKKELSQILQKTNLLQQFKKNQVYICKKCQSELKKRSW